MPTQINRGAIAIPQSVKDRAAERGLGRRRRSYDQLLSPPPGIVTPVEEAVDATEQGTGRRETIPAGKDEMLSEGNGKQTVNVEVR